MRNILPIILLSLLSMTSFFVQSKPKFICPVNPSYDITVTPQTVLITQQDKNIIIYPNGQIWVNGNHLAKLSSKDQVMAQKYQSYLRTRLPQLEKEANGHLIDLKNHFDSVIANRLESNTYLSNELNALFDKLIILFHKSISTKNNTTKFNHNEYNLLRSNGEKIVKDTFFSLIGSSIKNMDLFKNYRNLKAIANQEWRKKKQKLKDFDQTLCQDFTFIEERNNEFFTQVP